ncbi:hypothetical protein CPB84DRAFT_1796244 [Gymnopilus junonius]|uniref:Uncharacterized protein n=1 Tax=Gymnopilus junonius TaxID=109634 RepID=A0A9P5N941_GYMJU|nr:hypothetical protein CPB84DRAFT_1796244 [Gymnopilus junonius]
MDWSKLRQTQYRRQYRRHHGPSQALALSLTSQRTVGYQGPHAPNTLLDQSTFQPCPIQYSQPAGHPESSSATSHKAVVQLLVTLFQHHSCPITPSIQLQTVEYPKPSNTSPLLLGPHAEPPMFSTDWETRPPLDYSNFSIAVFSQGRHLPSASLAATSTTREQKHDKSADEPSSSSLPSASDNENLHQSVRLLDHLNEIEKMVILNIQHPSTLEGTR